MANFVDTIKPDEEGMAHFQPILDEWRDTVFPEGYEGGDGEVKKKKTTRKRGKEVEGYEGDWAKLIASDANMGKVTIPQIKVKLNELNLPVAGNKSVLWERLKSKLGDSTGANYQKVEDEEEDSAPKKRSKVKKEKVKQEVEEEF